MEANLIANCNAILSKVTTTVDGTVRVTIDIGEDEIEESKKLLAHNIKNKSLLYVTFCEIKEKDFLKWPDQN